VFHNVLFQASTTGAYRPVFSSAFLILLDCFVRVGGLLNQSINQSIYLLTRKQTTK